MKIRNTYEKIRNNVKKILLYGAIISTSGMIIENVLNQLDRSRLEKTAIEFKEDPSLVANLYGFDDDGNGEIDRIEIRGTIPGYKSGAIMAYHRTVKSSDSDFLLQNKRLKTKRIMRNIN